ncbi:MAG: dipeptide ABC transporter ATP-binding protein [Beijerinckiaceae bacterium]|nr:dipeptide ABC transporter ATP-binding protein [Beijerinckiaceae bacterium]
MSALLEVTDVRQEYSVKRGFFGKPATVKALNGITFELAAGRTLAIVGESGSGKSTLARLVTMIEEPTAGSIRLNGADIGAVGSERRRSLRGDVQIVFQNPFGSLNPRQTIRDALEEPLKVNTALSASERREAGRAMMARVGLRPEHDTRYPHMFSGGQRQRIAIARALMLRPKVLVLDEPVSALDVSIRAQVLNLLAELQQEFNLAYLFISHDLSVVRHIADEIMVIYLGSAVETGPAKTIFANPQHPYTRALLSATPVAEPGAKKERIILRGELPSPFDPPKGCAFNPRCPLVFDRCRVETPRLMTAEHREVACFAVEPPPA